MKKRKVNIYSLVLAGVMSLGVLSACGSSNEPAKPNESAPTSTAPAADSTAPAATDSTAPTDVPAPPAAGGEATGKIIIATENETPSLHTAAHNAVAGDYMNQLTYSALFRTNSADLSPTPDLVESYKAISDTEWEFVLKENITFHDGKKLTAEDVKATLEWNKQFPDSTQYTGDVESVEVIDERTFKIFTAEPKSMLLDNLSHHSNGIVSKELIESGHDFNQQPIGTGPYKYVNWTFGDSLDFEAFEDYFDPSRKASIKDMTWRIIPEGSSRTIALEAGEVDLVVELATQDIPRLQENPDIEVLLIPGTSHNFMMINNELTDLHFDNLSVRRALDMAIDKEAVVAVALDGLAVPVYHQVPTGFTGVSDENINSYDPEAAKALLAEAGVDPAEIKFEIICSNDQKRRCGEVIQSNLAEIGIVVDLVSMDLATYLDVTKNGNYQAAIGGYTSSALLTYVNGVWHSKSIGGSNKTRTNDPEIDKYLDEANATVDADAREQVLLKGTARINELCGQVPIYQDTVKRAFNAKLVVPELGASGTLPYNMVYWAE